MREATTTDVDGEHWSKLPQTKRAGGRYGSATIRCLLLVLLPVLAGGLSAGTPPVADLAIDKRLDSTGPFQPGDTVNYTLTLSNLGPEAATTVFVDDLPANLTITQVTSDQCPSLPCQIAQLAVGQSVIISLAATIVASGDFDNVAQTFGAVNDPDQSNNIDNTGNGGTTSFPDVILGPGRVLMIDSNTKSVYVVDPGSGDRSVLSGGLGFSPYPLVGSGVDFETLQDVEFHPDGYVLVADGNGDALIAVDPQTRVRSLFSFASLNLGPPFEFPSRLVIDQVTGVIYVTDPVANAVFAVDPQTGDRSIVSNSAVGSGPMFERVVGLAMANPTTLIVSDLDRSALFEVNILSGARTLFSGDPDGLNIGSGPLPRSSHLNLLADGSVVLNSFEDEILRVSRSTGNRVVISGVGVGSGPLLDLPNGGIAIDAGGRLLVGDQSLEAIVRIDPLTGDRVVVMSGTVGQGAAFVSPDNLYALPG